MKKVNLVFISISLISIFLVACNFYSDKNLGANYLFLENGDQSEIVYGETGTQGSFTIIDANVSQYNFDDKYIIAKSNCLLKDGVDAYWIINKQIKINKDTSLGPEMYSHELKKALIGPLNKDSFELLLNEYHIKFKLKNAY